MSKHSQFMKSIKVIYKIEKSKKYILNIYLKKKVKKANNSDLEKKKNLIIDKINEKVKRELFNENKIFIQNHINTQYKILGKRIGKFLEFYESDSKSKEKSKKKSNSKRKEISEDSISKSKNTKNYNRRQYCKLCLKEMTRIKIQNQTNNYIEKKILMDKLQINFDHEYGTLEHQILLNDSEINQTNSKLKVGICNKSIILHVPNSKKFKNQYFPVICFN